MFYEVRLLDRKNKVKKIISSQQLSRKYWDNFETNFNASTVKPKTGRSRSPAKNNLFPLSIRSEEHTSELQSQ